MIDTQAIRSKILDLAMRGQLTEQLPEDGTAEELYQQILEEKQKLIKEGKIKKQKPLPEITDEEIPFDIPNHWKWVRMDEITSKVTSGSTPKGGKKSNAYVSNGFPFFREQNIYNDGIHTDGMVYISNDLLCTRLNSTVIAKDILLNITGGSIGRCALIPDDFDRGSINQHILILRMVKPEIRFYIHKLMCSSYVQNYIKNKSVGDKDGFSGGRCKQMLIPFPPLAEQKRIVEKIEQSFSILDTIDELQAQYADNRTALKSKLVDAAIQGKLTEQLPEDGTAEELYQQIQEEKQKLIKEGKIKKQKPLPEIPDEEIPFDIPDNWKWIRLGNVGVWRAGSTPSRSNADYYDGSIPWLKTGELNDSYITKVSEFITDKALKDCSVQLNPIGSVLIAMYGATIGKLGIAGIALTTNQACCACVPFNGVYNRYVFYLLMSMRKTFIGMGIGGAQSNISKDKIVHSIIPLPPLAEQKRIVQKLDEILPLCE